MSAAALTGPSRGGGDLGQDGERILIAAGAERFDRGELFVLGLVRFEHGDGACLAHQPRDRRVLLGGKRGVEERDGIGVAALEDGFGGCPPRRRVRAHQRERAERGADAAAELVVDLDLLDGVARRLAGVGLGDRVDELVAVAGFLGDEDGAVGLARVEIAGGERIENRGGGRVAGGGDRRDLLFDLVVAALAELIDERFQVGRVGDGHQARTENDRRGQCAKGGRYDPAQADPAHRASRGPLPVPGGITSIARLKKSQASALDQ